MTKPALLSPQDHRHVHLRRPSLAFKQLVVATPTINPHRVLAMREFDHRHFSGIFEYDLGIAMRHFDSFENVRSGLDMALVERLHPVHLIADDVRRQCRQGFARLLQYADRRRRRVVYAIFGQR